MFEELIASLDEMGLEYVEDYDAGTLTVDVGVIDKVQVINLIQAVTDLGLEFTIDEASLVVTGGDTPEAPEELEEPEEFNQEDAMNEMFGM